MLPRILFLSLFFFPLMSFSQSAFEINGAGIKNGIWRYKNFPSKLVEPRIIDVWLPANYSEKKKYAVLYMHDGQNLFNPSESFGGVDWNIDQTLQRLIDEKKVRETIVVGIWNTSKRTIEYAPRKVFDLATPNQKKDFATNLGEADLSDKYLEFLVTELKPFIDKTYSTKTDLKNTFVMGSSMGGLMSLYAISEYPQIFGGAGCVSTHFPLGEGVMLEYMKKNLPSPKNHKIYFDYGTQTLDATYEPFQIKADEIMQRNGYKQNKNWITRKFEGEEHSEKSWRKRVDIPLVFLLGK